MPLPLFGLRFRPVRSGPGPNYTPIFRENRVLIVYKACYNKLTKAPLPGFITSSRDLLQEERDLPKVYTSDRFDPNLCKLMKKSSYDFNTPTSIGYVTEVKPYGLNDMQKIIQRWDAGVHTPKIGLGYIPSQPVKIPRWCKDKQSLTQSQRTKLMMMWATMLRPIQNQ